MAFLISFLCAFAGALVGWFVAAAATLIVGGWLGMSDFEGERAMTAVFGAGPVGALVGLVIGMLLAARWIGRRRSAAGQRAAAATKGGADGA